MHFSIFAYSRNLLLYSYPAFIISLQVSRSPIYKNGCPLQDTPTLTTQGQNAFTEETVAQKEE